MKPGTVTFVGAGPGDPGLLTRLGVEALQNAQAVVYDNLIDPRLLDLAPPSAQRFFVGKSRGHASVPQDQINARLVDLAQSGLQVVRLKGGDSFVYGRGAEEAETLAAAAIPFRVIPGVTAAVGVTAYAGIPLTHRDDASAVAFVTGHDDPSTSHIDWQALAAFPGTLVVYMGFSRLASYCQALIDAGKSPDTPAALIQWGTWPRQLTVESTLAQLPAQVHQAALGPPAIVVFGHVVHRRHRLSWFEKLPLFGRTILVTRPATADDSSTSLLDSLGAEVLHATTIEILPPLDFEPIDRAIACLDLYHWLVFTSANGVRHFLDRILHLGPDMRSLSHLKLAAIGPATAEALRSYHLNADLVPDEFCSESLVAALAPHVAGKRLLLARADRGREVLRDGLAPIAQRVDQIAVYRNADVNELPPRVQERLQEGSLDWVTVTSSAIARRLHELLTPEARALIGTRIRLASISPVTSETLRELGWHVALEAPTFTWPALVQALVAAETEIDRPENPTS